MKVLNAAIIGYGLSGKVFHAPLISAQRDLNLSLIYTSQATNVDDIKQRYPKCTHTDLLEDIFSSEVDLVVITSPNKLHYEHAMRALNDGKHIMVEKPFALTSTEANEVLQLAKEKSLVCSVFHNRRRDSDFKTVKRIIESGKLGDIKEYEAHFDRFRNYQKPNAWKEQSAEPGAGILFDLGPHLIDQALHLFGHPEELYADIRCQRTGIDVNDNFELILYYPNLKVTLKAGMLVKEPLPKFIVLGDQGSFVKYGADVQEAQAKQGLGPLGKDWGVEEERFHGILNYSQAGEDFRETIVSEKGDYLSLYQNLVKDIIEDANTSIRGEDGYNVIKVIEYAIESSECKCRVAVKGLY